MSRKDAEFFIENEPHQLRVTYMKARAVRAEEHTDDLFQHPQRKKIIGINQRWPFRCADENAHRLQRPRRIGGSIPAPSVAVAFLAQRKGSRAPLLHAP